MGIKRIIFSWSYIGILWLIITPFIIYCCHRLYQYRFHPAVSNRFWKASLALEIAVLGIIIINRPLTAFIFLLKYTDHIVPFALSTLTWAIFYYFIVFGYAFRIWFLRYKTQFSLEIEEKQWRAIINKTHWGHTWYLKHINTFGNQRWVAIRILILYIIIVIAHVSIYVITFDNTISQGFLMLVSLPALLFELYLLCRINESHDVFFLRYELNCIMVVTILALIATITSTVLNLEDKWYTDLISDNVGVVYSLLFTIIQTLVVLKKCRLLGQEPMRISLTDHTKQKFKIDFKSMLHLGDTGDLTHENQLAVHQQRERKYSANSVMTRYFKTVNEEEQFALFCKHLTMEWSIENMVGFIEFAQIFRALLIHRPKELELHLGLLIEYKFKNVDELPRSDVVFDHKTYPKLSDKILALYNKYITSSGDFQLNLSAQVRNRWIEATRPLIEPLSHKRGLSSIGRRLSTQIQRARQSSILRKEQNKNKDKTSSKHNAKLPLPEVIHEVPSTCSDTNTVPMPTPDNINIDSTEIVYNEVANDTPVSPIDGAIDFVRAFTIKRQKTKDSNNVILEMSLDDTNLDYSIDPLIECEMDIDLNLFLPLIQRVLEQCHLLLMDSYSRFKHERDRKVTYDMNDDTIIKTHTIQD